MTVNSDDHTVVDYINLDSADLFEKTHHFGEFLTDWRGKGTYAYQMPLRSACGSRAMLLDRATGQTREVILLASNNYLGLNRHPDVVQAAHDAIDRYGSGMCGSRFVSGTYEEVEALEDELAAFECRPKAAVFTTGYQANVATLSGLLRADDVVFVDRLNHASIIDGCRMAGCRMRIFRHNDPEHLDRIMGTTACKGARLVVVDGVFSMDGDLAPLPDLLRVARKHGARFMVDEAHGTGVVGPTGRGASEHFGIHDEVDLLVGTFSKTLGATGGFVAGPRDVVEYIVHYGHAYMFTASPVPAAIAAVRCALGIIARDGTFRERLWENIHYLRAGLTAAGLTVDPDPAQSAILTIPIGADTKTRKLNVRLFEEGLFVCVATYPAVSRDQAKIRLSVSALHTRQDLDEAIAILSRVTSGTDDA